METVAIGGFFVVLGIILIVKPEIYTAIMRISNASRGLETKHSVDSVGRIIGVGSIAVGLLLAAGQIFTI